MGQAELGLLKVVLRLGHVDLRDRAALMRALVRCRSRAAAWRSIAGLVERLARGGARDLPVQRRAAGLGLEAGQRRALLGQRAA